MQHFFHEHQLSIFNYSSIFDAIIIEDMKISFLHDQKSTMKFFLLLTSFMIKKTTNNFLLHEYPTRKLQHHHFEKGEIFYFTTTLILILIICFEILIFYYAILQLLEKKNTLGQSLRHPPRCWCSRLAILIAYNLS